MATDNQRVNIGWNRYISKRFFWTPAFGEYYRDPFQNIASRWTLGMGLGYTLSFLMTAPVAYGVPETDVGAVLVIRHDTIPIALNDSAWAKYSLGEMFNISDPDTNAPAVRNPYYLKPGAFPFEAAALQKLIDRGVKVAACDLALTFWSSVAAKKMGLMHEDVKAEWLDAVHPGIQVVPSGTVACHGAVGRGCSYLLAG